MLTAACSRASARIALMVSIAGSLAVVGLVGCSGGSYTADVPGSQDITAAKPVPSRFEAITCTRVFAHENLLVDPPPSTPRVLRVFVESERAFSDLLSSAPGERLAATFEADSLGDRKVSGHGNGSLEKDRFPRGVGNSFGTTVHAPSARFTASIDGEDVTMEFGNMTSSIDLAAHVVGDVPTAMPYRCTFKATAPPLGFSDCFQLTGLARQLCLGGESD